MRRRQRPDPPGLDGSHQEYWLDAGQADGPACGRSLVETMARFAPYAVVDLLPDPSQPNWHRMPAEARTAWGRLAPRAARAARPAGPYFGWAVDLTDEPTRGLVAAWAPYSINVELYRTSDRDLSSALTLHDEGAAIYACLSVEEAGAVEAALTALGFAAAWKPV